jgi:alkanesulfonate monooxygenase SsuD/methylene tetrahydromethanopterin reductase-like flavin-dependent oxidoreductase (luciferase family)
MIGSNGPADARHRPAARRRVEHVVGRLRQHGRGLRELNATITAAARDAGRDPADILRSACAWSSSTARGPAPDPARHPPLEGSPEQIAARLRELGDAGADEVILVATRSTSGRSGRWRRSWRSSEAPRRPLRHGPQVRPGVAAQLAHDALDERARSRPGGRP